MTELTFTAPSYAFLRSTMPCWKCSQATSVITVWVPSFIDAGDIQKPEDEPEVGGTSTLRYIHALDDQVAAHVRDVAPWLKPWRSEPADTIFYWANHCGMCAAIQGDHFVLGVNGPFFPQTRAQADALQVIPGRGPLAANSSAAQSSWMDWIAERMPG